MENTKFINSLLIKTLIEREFGLSDIKVKSYNLEDISEKTPELSTRSILNRLCIKYVKKNGEIEVASFVTKVKPTKGELSEEFKVCNDFSKEISIYKSVMPDIVDNLKKVGIKIVFSPRVVTTFSTPEGLVFEDVSSHGYHTQFELNGLTKEQSLMALDKLAHFHAASALLLEKSAFDKEKFSKGTLHFNWQNKLIYFQLSNSIVTDNASELGIDKAIAEKLKKFSNDSLKKAIEDYTSSLNGFDVLNHGDYWTKNIFFKYKGNELKDAMFVDFQNVVIGTPLIDLLYFLATSVNVEVLKESRDELIYSYHKTLSQTLQQLKFKGHIPSLNEIQIDILKKESMDLYFILTIAPYLRTPKPKITVAVQPNLYKEEYLKELKENGKRVLAMHKNFIIAELGRLNAVGALDVANEGLVQSMKNKFKVK